ncbi:MAG: NUDIX hydrolase [Parcubacteria group bacterium Gr01-1014_29]|nr:MAG: NUDIX hydrolase [Parcubacteria group bacterium Gr01-1014_29]
MDVQKQYIDKIAWIYIKDRKILSTRSYGKDTYYIPGGKREAGESDMHALRREIKEELTVDILPETIKYVGVFSAQAHGKPEGIIVRMICYSSECEGAIRPSSEIEEIIWCNHKDREKSSPVDKIIFDWLKERDLIE